MALSLLHIYLDTWSVTQPHSVTAPSLVPQSPPAQPFAQGTQAVQGQQQLLPGGKSITDPAKERLGGRLESPEPNGDLFKGLLGYQVLCTSRPPQSS